MLDLDIFTQAHQQVCWGNVTPPAVRTHQLIAITDESITLSYKPPNIYAALSIQGDCALLSYFIQKHDRFDIMPFDRAYLGRKDLLWVDNCLEYFFTLDDSTAYVEMNFAPQGSFNLYRFDDYRNPDIPTKTAGIAFTQNFTRQAQKLDDYHVRHVGIKLDGVYDITPKQYNLSVILYDNSSHTPIYFAITHACKPDFHDKEYWQIW